MGKKVKRPRKDQEPRWSNVDINQVESFSQFVSYYGPTGLNILKLLGRDEMKEWNELITTLKRPLPATFRISPCGNFQKRTLRSVNQQVSTITSTTTYPVIDPITKEIIAFEPPKQIGEWCPEAWTTGTFRSGLRNVKSLKQFHTFIVRATETGAISRQELVSMVPAILLDVQPGNYILDMCAAPGSKSLQILEKLEIGNGGGVLVANDVDAKRAYMLTKRTKNVKSASLVVTTHDASQFPIQRTKEGAKLFDRVLCDVPCSGDGTLRKNISLWKSLKVRDGMALHSLQLRIASKAILCVKPGGMIVYSTCSFNPLENEAVVCELLKIFAGEIELVDASKSLPGLIFSPGLSQPWKVPNILKDYSPSSDGLPKVEFFSTFEESQVKKSIGGEEDKNQHLYRESMFPPSNLLDLNINRCIRLLPHDQDSGGFFVAVFKKIRDVQNEKRSAALQLKQQQQREEEEEVVGGLLAGEEMEEEKMVPSEEKNYLRKKKPNKNDVWYEEISDDVWKIIQNEWGIQNLDKKRFQIRVNAGEKEQAEKKNSKRASALPTKVSYINDDVLKLFERSTEKGNNLHIVHAGVLAFQRSKNFTYRITNDYASLLLPYLTERVISISLNDLKILYEQLKEQNLLGKEKEEKEEGEAEEEEEEEEIASVDEDDEVDVEGQKGGNKEKSKTLAFEANVYVKNLHREQSTYLLTIPEGGVVLKLNSVDQEKYSNEIGGVFAMSAWWGNKTLLRAMVEKNEIVELLLQLREVHLI